MKFIVPTFAIINHWNNVQAFDIKSDKNLIAYWGQNSYGSSSEAEAAKMEKPLREYCNDDTYDMFVVSFLTKFNAESPSLYPELNLGKHCHQTFPGTNLANCPEVGQDIKYCQSKGKAVVLSMGGYSGDYTIKQEKHAHHLANKMWDLFLGGKSKFRPFGDVVLDGVDLDIEKGPPENYAAFTHALRNITLKDNSKKYYITAAPQCPYPDASLKAVLERGWLDAAFVQFYNNPCGLGSDSFNFEQWDNWAKTGSVNKDVKIYLGAPASPSASNTGYLPIKKLAALIEKTRSKHSSFGGVMIWDVSQGQANFCSEIKASYSEGLFRALSGGSSSSKPEDQVEHEPQSEAKPEEKPVEKPEVKPENSPIEIKPQATPAPNSAEGNKPKPEQASPAPESAQASPAPSAPPSPSAAELPAPSTVASQANSADRVKPSKNDGMYTPETKPTNTAVSISAPSQAASEPPKQPPQAIDIEDIEEAEEENEDESYPEPNELPSDKPTAAKSDLGEHEEMTEHEVAASLLEAYLAPIVSMYNNQPESSPAQAPHAIIPEEIQPPRAPQATLVKEDRDSLPTPDINFMEQAQMPASPAPPQAAAPAPAPAQAPPQPPVQPASQPPQPNPSAAANPPESSPSVAAPPAPSPSPAPPQQNPQPAAEPTPIPPQPQATNAVPAPPNEPPVPPKPSPAPEQGQNSEQKPLNEPSNPSKPSANPPSKEESKPHPDHLAGNHSDSSALKPAEPHRPSKEHPYTSSPSNPGNSTDTHEHTSPSAVKPQHQAQLNHDQHTNSQAQHEHASQAQPQTQSQHEAQHHVESQPQSHASTPSWIAEEAKKHPGSQSKEHQSAYSGETAPKPQAPKSESKPTQIQSKPAASKPSHEKPKAESAVGFEVNIEAEDEDSEDRE